jgi:hypothetical protein
LDSEATPRHRSSKSAAAVVEVARRSLEYYRLRLLGGDHLGLHHLIAMEIRTLERFTPMFPDVATSLISLRRDLIELAQRGDFGRSPSGLIRTGKASAPRD